MTSKFIFSGIVEQ